MNICTHRQSCYGFRQCLFFLLTTLPFAPCSDLAEIRYEKILSTTELIRKFGYPSETHHATTSDGYILELHRIPYNPKSASSSKKTPVLVLHALSCSSTNWVENGSGKGFGFILADLEYDVWLGNSRGNTYSRNHTTLDPNKADGPFWDFSWHEMGMYDVPAMIDYILKLTGQPKLFYIGHSQGTTQFYVMASERPEYNDKIRAMFSLAPVAFMSHAQSPLLQAASVKSVTSELMKIFGVREFLPRSKLFAAVAPLCADGQLTQILCSTILFYLCGFDEQQMNTTALPAFISNTPAGSSTKEYFHYMQGVASAKFRMYDYGKKGNLRRYGSKYPPSYNLSKITVPISLHYGANDWLAATKDVDILHDNLPNTVGKFLISHPQFNHLDFFWAKDVKTLVYDQVTDLMAKFENTFK